jgi:hypothetical protein
MLAIRMPFGLIPGIMLKILLKRSYGLVSERANGYDAGHRTRRDMWGKVVKLRSSCNYDQIQGVSSGHSHLKGRATGVEIKENLQQTSRVAGL